MDINENARIVLEKRYLIRDEQGRPLETVEGLFRRVAQAIAESDKAYGTEPSDSSESFFALMANLDFLPNSPTLMNAGRPLGQLSACFVLPVEDTMEGIFDSIKNAALIHKSGGGTGFSFSRLRAKGSMVNSTGGVASGPISFMKVFNAATEAVKQGGTRRGANMGILRVDHPDILEFIDCKSDNAEITNFNISVGLTERFMRAVEAGEEYELIDPATKTVVGTLDARAVFEKIVSAAWQNGEPGMIFLDRLNRDNVVPSLGEIESTNPCGEQPLLPYESCNLGSINLTRMLRETAQGYEIDWDRLALVTKQGIHFLDNVIDANKYPLEIIGETTMATRKVGLGVMGWADMLLRLDIPYCSDEAVELGERLMRFINEKAHEESAKLAAARGAFPLFGESVYAGGKGLRNATCTTIAPTGTLSIIAGCSSGIEPVFGYVFIRNVMDGTELIEVNPILKETLQKRGLYSDDLMRKIAKEGSLAHIEELPDDLKAVFVTAHEVGPEYHIRMQAAFQRHTDNAVSKTVNFCSEATIDDVREVYMLAYRLDLKGVTIYRDGSRCEQVLNIGAVKKKDAVQNDGANCVVCEDGQTETAKLRPRPRPEITTGFTEKVRIGCGNLYITVNYDEEGICEVFTNTGRAGGCPSQSEATSRLVSIALRSGIDAASIVEQLRGIRCLSTIRQKGMKATSCPDAISRVIEKVLKLQNGQGADGSSVPAFLPAGPEDCRGEMDVSTNAIRFCPECGAGVEHEGGCVVCRNCGYSKCG